MEFNWNLIKIQLIETEIEFIEIWLKLRKNWMM